jgi:hypothetical protein
MVSTPEDLRLLVTESRIVLRARFTHDGVVYARSSTHLGNSLIFFYPRDDKSSPPIPGSIKYIFDTRDGTAFAVQRHLMPEPGTIDPFALYPDFPARLYSTSLNDTLEMVKVGWITSHFARWQISPEHVVVLSLSKVCILYSLIHMDKISFCNNSIRIMYIDRRNKSFIHLHINSQVVLSMTVMLVQTCTLLFFYVCWSYSDCTMIAQ